MLRVTADTNILISGLNFRGGKPFQFLDLARAGKINLTVSDAILDEMEDVLVRKFSFTPENVGEARRRIKAMARTVKPVVTLDVIREDPPDNRILECAVAAGSDYIRDGGQRSVAAEELRQHSNPERLGFSGHGTGAGTVNVNGLRSPAPSSVPPINLAAISSTLHPLCDAMRHQKRSARLMSAPVRP